MGNNTKVEWCDVTWSPVTGCSPISDGCQNCYAKRMANRLRGRFGYPKDDPFKVTYHRERLAEPLKYKRSRRIFTVSMGDLFHDEVTDMQRENIFRIMWIEECRHHNFLIITKRPENALSFFIRNPHVAYPDIKNYWIGVTAENQRTADERIPILLQIPAAIRFISVEPMLGPVDLNKESDLAPMDCCAEWMEYIDWVICGAETGPGKREMKYLWALNLLDQCEDAGIPFFFKKDSYGYREIEGKIYEQFPET